MIELTTGVVFLMSSLYGMGHSNVQALAIGAVDNAQDVAPKERVIAKSTLSKVDTSDPKSVEAYLRQEFRDTPILVDIARCESSFRHNDEDGIIIRGRVNSADVGVMQINEKYHGERAIERGIDIYTIDGNIEYAKRLYKESGGQPWISSSKCWSKDLAVK